MKKLLLDPVLVISVLMVLFFTYTFSQRAFDRSLSEKLDMAAKSYESGLKAGSVSEKQDRLNAALKIYREIESDFEPQKNGAFFYFDLGNVYYQLALYPYAAVNYEKARQLLPNDALVLQNLDLTRKMLGLAPETASTVFKFTEYFTLRWRFIAFHLSLLLSTLLASWLIWKNSEVVKKLTYFFAFATVLLLLSLAYTYYTSPIEAVVVEPSFLYKGGGEEYAKVVQEPLKAGLKVEVIGSNYNGQWLKVLTPSAEVGYLSKQKIEQVSF